jgi:hypothetical protein
MKFPTQVMCRLCTSDVSQIDNAAYVVGLSERVRTRVEKFGRVKLSEKDAGHAALLRSKTVHVVLLVVAVLVAVWSGNGAIVFLAPFLAFWLGGVAEAVASADNDTEDKVTEATSTTITTTHEAAGKIKAVGKVTAAAVLGVVGIIILIVAAGGAIALKNSVGVLLR